jgi:hypothetical protein
MPITYKVDIRGKRLFPYGRQKKWLLCLKVDDSYLKVADSYWLGIAI